MVIAWRSHAYRGGSRWAQPAFVVAYVGIVAAPIVLLPSPIVDATVDATAVAHTVTARLAQTVDVAGVRHTVTFEG